jgi:hypothetical protein
MRRRKAVLGLAVAFGSAVGAFLLRQRTAQRGEKVDLHFSDGTMASLDAGAPSVDRLLELGRTVLALARD